MVDGIDEAVVADFVATLIPEAFERPTMARQVVLEDRGEGPEAFDAWAVDRVAEALAARWPGGGRPVAVGAVSDGRLRWWFDDGGCERLECVASIMGREAALVEQPWVFGAVLARPRGSWEVVHDEDGNEIDEVWRPPTRTFWQAAWYAEARGRGAATRQSGLLHLDGDEVVDHQPLEVRHSRVTRQLHGVLHRHPARKRFPLRRRRR